MSTCKDNPLASWPELSSSCCNINKVRRRSVYCLTHENVEVNFIIYQCKLIQFSDLDVSVTVPVKNTQSVGWVLGHLHPCQTGHYFGVRGHLWKDLPPVKQSVGLRHLMKRLISIWCVEFSQQQRLAPAAVQLGKCLQVSWNKSQGRRHAQHTQCSLLRRYNK